MIILAFMQNMYFKNPERVRAIFDRNPDKRNYFIKQFLFMGCKSGKVLLKTLGESLCWEGITWEESSREIGSYSSSKFPVDRNHVANAMRIHSPGLILAFGDVAKKAVQWYCTSEYADNVRSIPVLYGPHPAARNNPLPALHAMRVEIERLAAQ